MKTDSEKKIDYKKEVEQYGAIAFVPKGNSMWPILKNRSQSVIIVKKDGRLQKNDVAFYLRDDGSFVLHRIISLTDKGYIACGDSQFTEEPINEGQVFGKMSGFYKGKKFIECTDKKYLKRVEKWYKKKTTRKIRLKFFYKYLRLKDVLRKMFKKPTNTDGEKEDGV